MDIYNAFAAGRENRWRREDRERQEAQSSVLKQLLIPAVEGNAEAMAALGQADPNAYFEAQKIRGQQQSQQQAQQEQQLKGLASMVGYLDRLPPDQRALAFPAIRQKAIQAGIATEELPQQWTPELEQALVPLKAQLAQYMPDGGAPKVVGAGGALVGPDGRELYRAEAKAPAPKYLPTDQGYAVVGPDGVAQPVQWGGGGGAPKLAPMQLAGMFQQFGGQITSAYRDPAKNKAVGGVANSQHMSGTGIDAVFPNPQVKADAIAFAQQNGYEAIDEGDHVHFELPRGGGAVRPPSGASKPPAGYRATENGELEPIPGGPATRPTAAQAKEQATIRAKLPRVRAAKRRIERLASAVESIAGGVFDGGPVDQYALQYSPAGQEVVQAAASLLPELTAITRTPGIGSQSDLETRLQNLQLPSLEFPPEVNRRALAELATFMADLEDAYGSTESGAQAAPSSGGYTPGQIIEHNGKRYRVTGGDPNDPDVEEVP